MNEGVEEMAISEMQLEAWTGLGAVQAAEASYAAVRNALASVAAVRYKDAGRSYDVYLQGSYKNNTNIRGDSDVDVVVELQSTFGYDLDELHPSEKARFHQEHSGSATYHLEEFREDVLYALRLYFGAGSVTEGDKAIKIAGAAGRLPADVVVCLEYHKYTHYLEGARRYVPGIRFYTQKDHRRVINYPTLHYDNGVAKNKATNERYKPAVRMFKNARNYMESNGLLAKNAAPSYFVQCFLYNAPDKAFSGNLQDAFFNVVSSLVGRFTDGTADAFMCQNGQVPLFGDTPEQWSQSNAIALLSALLKLWGKGT